MNSKTSSIILTLVVIASFITILIEIAPEVGASQTIYVDDSNTTPPWLGTPADPYQYIQDGVDAAQPGDTVFVSAGTYYEDVTITNTINLTGEDRDNTIINSTNQMGIYIEYIDFVNITGFTVENSSWSGIRLRNSNNSLIGNNKFQNSQDGLQFLSVYTSVISNNIFANIYSDAIYLYESSNNLIKNSSVSNSRVGISLDGNSQNNTVIHNNCSNNEHGLIIDTGSSGNTIIDNIFNNNNGIFTFHTGITLGTSANDNIFINNTMKLNKYGFFSNSVKGNILINSTIQDSLDQDIYIKSDVDLVLLNTTFNKSSVMFTSDTSILTVKWYLHVNVVDYFSNPVPNAKVKIEDNLNGSYNLTFITDPNGHLRWLPITEYIEQDTNGDSIGEKTYYTPHKIIAWNGTIVGYAKPIMNESKTINIVLFNGTLLNLEPGWNIISLPRSQEDTKIDAVLQSIEGRYLAVRYYNNTDIADHWKHFHIIKPPFMNNLGILDHLIGFWIYIHDPEGTTLVLFGDKFTSQQDIELYKGWNLVGYPSNNNKTRTSALNNIDFDNDVNIIWTYNSTVQEWKEIGEFDFFEIGRGYWIHSKVIKTWNVPV